MVYYVAYRASKELKNRSQIARRLHVLGCKKIKRAFWEVDENKIGAVTGILQKNHPIVMKRRREIERPSYTKEGKVSDPGSLIVIAYKGSKKDRMKVDFSLKRSPCIRLCRGVYAFSHWHKRFDKAQELVDARRFWNFIRDVDENAIVYQRLVIDNSEIMKKILEETTIRIEKNIEKISEGYKRLYQKMRRGDGDRKSVLSMAGKLRKRFVTVKKLGRFYEKWYRVDLSHLLMKPYPAIRKLHSLLDEKFIN